MPNYKERTGIQVMSGTGLNVFTRDQMDTIHFASLKILEKTGLIVENKEAAEIFASGGAKVKPHGKHHFRVWLPQHLVNDCISWAPRSVTYYGRDPKNDFQAEPGRVGFTTFGECINIIDPVTRVCRPSTKEDCGNTAKVIDALDELVVTLRTVCSGDQYPDAQPVHNIEALFNNTSKHVFLGIGSGANVEVMVKVAHEISGGEDAFRARPIFTACLCPTSPLTLVDQCCEGIMTCARNGVGIMIIPMALSGGSSPATLTGTLLQHNCEELSAIVLAQLTRRGTCCTYGSCTTIMDLKTGNSAVGAPEYGIINSGLAKMAGYYQLPAWVGGGLSDAKMADAQIGYEFTINAIQGALAGANIVYGSGCLELGLTFDYAKLMMDHECMRNIRKVLQGLPTDNESLCLSLIEEVGPGGTFLTHRHTLKNARSQSKADLFDRNGREKWARLNPDGRTVTDRAYDRAQKILAEHQPLPLPPAVAESVSRIVQDYEKSLRAAKK